MALSKLKHNELSILVCDLTRRGINLSLEGDVVIFQDPAGVLLATHDFGGSKAFAVDALSLEALLAEGLKKYVTRICKPDHEGVFCDDWEINSCSVNGTPFYDYADKTFGYSWRICFDEVQLELEDYFKGWPTLATLLAAQNELVWRYHKLKPLYEFLKRHKIEVKMEAGVLRVGNFAIRCEFGAFEYFIKHSPNPEDIQGLEILCGHIVVLNILKEYATPMAHAALQANKPTPSMTCEIELA